MTKESAGLLVFRRRDRALEFLLVHPGGPFWQNKDLGAWSIPKGEIDRSEDKLAAARRELKEETGFEVEDRFTALSPVKLKGGKIVHAFLAEGDFDPATMICNTFEMEWPPRSGRRQSFPECDRAAWFAADEALERINPGQRPLIEEALMRLERS
jgi:predicted NUDIX family NTP pyrophosphohydrolase